MIWKLGIGLLCMLPLNILAQENDVAGSSDYPLLSRMPDYNIRNYQEFDFDAHDFRTGDDTSEVVEGRKVIVRFEHQAASDRSVEKPSYLQILRNYSNAITAAGGQVLFEHRNSDYGHYFMKTAGGTEVWAEISTAPDRGRRYTLTVVEQAAMEQDVSVTADLIRDRLNLDGRIAIYGIYFDTNASVLKTESNDTLAEIARFLKENPDVDCWVVGHTDSDGSFEINSALSLARARAVAGYLLTNHGIAEDRLFAEGVGPLAPVATNTTEEGKQLNRRVELVRR